MDRVLARSMLSTPFFPHEPIRTDGPSYLACARHARYMLRHAAVAIPPISQPMHCASVAGRAHTLAIWVAFGGVVGDSIRRDWPSGLLLAPLCMCQVCTKCTDFPWGALAHHTCCPTAAIWCGVRSRYPTTYGGVRGCGRRRAGRLNPYSAVRSSLPSKLV